jgi:hypothetical protein
MLNVEQGISNDEGQILEQKLQIPVLRRMILLVNVLIILTSTSDI